MFHENEIVMFALGVGVFLLGLANRSRVKSIPNAATIVTAYCLFLVAWACTILEGYFWENIHNALEHACYACGAVLMAVWCWRVTRTAPPAETPGRPQ